jgi:hypothetical protein
MTTAARILFLALLLSLAGCGGSDPADDLRNTQPVDCAASPVCK